MEGDWRDTALFAAVLLLIAGKGGINEDLDGSFFLLFKDQMNKCCNIMDEENPFEHHFFYSFVRLKKSLIFV